MFVRFCKPSPVYRIGIFAGGLVVATDRLTFEWRSKDPRTRLPSLLSAAEFQIGTWNWRRAIRHSVWALDYPHTDWGRYRVGAVSNPWKQREGGVAHLYAPGVTYWTDLRGVRRPLRSTFINFRNGAAAGLNAFVQNRAHFCRFIDTERRLLPLLQRLAHLDAAQTASGFWTAQALFFQVIQLLHTSEAVDAETRRILPSDRPIRDSDFARQVREFLNRHLGDRVTVEQIAHHVGTSVSSLAHRYSVETGEPPMKALARLRVELAKGLILRGFPFKAVAESAGFCDVYHFSKAFKRVQGVSPKAFREAHTDE